MNKINMIKIVYKQYFWPKYHVQFLNLTINYKY